ncbi:hypothetical protein LOAG_14313 [Loa loa]|uniref:Uncharacterized protein n=1 Tax=Loa loa TaxID=7209 RepID=A0A1S0THT9_LOALO|nr:hypothetical protein LOAG_14313 [Loa loa]EFO14210.1 hypothetical protein LOAG_14313 [Loa loa]
MYHFNGYRTTKKASFRKCLREIFQSIRSKVIREIYFMLTNFAFEKIGASFKKKHMLEKSEILLLIVSAINKSIANQLATILESSFFIFNLHNFVASKMILLKTVNTKKQPLFVC